MVSLLAWLRTQVGEGRAGRDLQSAVFTGTERIVAITASADTHSLMPSRSTTWVAAGAGVRPSCSATDCSTDGSMFE